jgi:hypothetical protein
MIGHMLLIWWKDCAPRNQTIPGSHRKKSPEVFRPAREQVGLVHWLVTAAASTTLFWDMSANLQGHCRVLPPAVRGVQSSGRLRRVIRCRLSTKLGDLTHNIRCNVRADNWRSRFRPESAGKGLVAATRSR